MKRFRVKVCGITKPDDGRLAAESGADLIGLIFYRGSERFVSRKKAEQIVRSLPPTVARVGVFVDEAVAGILRVAERLRLDYIQLHGHEPASQIVKLQREGFRVIKAFAIRKRADYQTVARSRADLRLLDHRTETKIGGTGDCFDWSIRPPREISNLVLAGGINVDNVTEGVKLFEPLVVEVNSGVESWPGVKSPTRLRAFMAECDRIRYGT